MIENINPLDKIMPLSDMLSEVEERIRNCLDSPTFAHRHDAGVRAEAQAILRAMELLRRRLDAPPLKFFVQPPGRPLD
jgi:hypothetical protein